MEFTPTDDRSRIRKCSQPLKLENGPFRDEIELPALEFNLETQIGVLDVLNSRVVLVYDRPGPAIKSCTNRSGSQVSENRASAKLLKGRF